MLRGTECSMGQTHEKRNYMGLWQNSKHLPFYLTTEDLLYQPLPTKQERTNWRLVTVRTNVWNPTSCCLRKPTFWSVYYGLKLLLLWLIKFYELWSIMMTWGDVSLISKQAQHDDDMMMSVFSCRILLGSYLLLLMQALFILTW